MPCQLKHYYTKIGLKWRLSSLKRNKKYIDLLSVLLHISDITSKSLDEFSLTFPNFSFD